MSVRRSSACSSLSHWLDICARSKAPPRVRRAVIIACWNQFDCAVTVHQCITRARARPANSRTHNKYARYKPQYQYNICMYITCVCVCVCIVMHINHNNRYYMRAPMCLSAHNILGVYWNTLHPDRDLYNGKRACSVHLPPCVVCVCMVLVHVGHMCVRTRRRSVEWDLCTNYYGHTQHKNICGCGTTPEYARV